MITIYYLGIDLGGTNIKAGIVDKDYTIIGRSSVKTRSPRPAAEIAQEMARAASLAAANAGVRLKDVRSAGFGSPGMVDRKNGVIEFSGNLGFRNAPLAGLLRDLLGFPVSCVNDADAAAYGEFIAGAGKGCRSFLAVTLGTGVGSGIIVDGKLLSGYNNAVGEMGHMVIVEGGEPCTCGRRGCFEAYASATALIRQTRSEMKKHPESIMWELTGGIDSVSGKTAFEALRRGDEAGRAVVEQYVRYIACGVTNAVNIFQPEVVCIGGGICNEEERYLMDPLREIVLREQFGGRKEKEPKICRAQLGNDAGIIGAAFLGA